MYFSQFFLLIYVGKNYLCVDKSHLCVRKNQLCVSKSQFIYFYLKKLNKNILIIIFF